MKILLKEGCICRNVKYRKTSVLFRRQHQHSNIKCISRLKTNEQLFLLQHCQQETSKYHPNKVNANLQSKLSEIIAQAKMKHDSRIANTPAFPPKMGKDPMSRQETSPSTRNILINFEFVYRNTLRNRLNVFIPTTNLNYAYCGTCSESASQRRNGIRLFSLLCAQFDPSNEYP